MIRFNYCEQMQIKRAERVTERLQDETLTKWAREYWKSVLSRLAKNQVQLDYTFKSMSRNG